MKPPTQKLPSLAIAFLLLAACSGSSGGSSPGLSNLVYTPDRFPASELAADTYTFELGVPISEITASIDGTADSFAIDPPFQEPTGTLGFGNVVPQSGDVLPVNGTALAFAPPEFTGMTTANERANVFVPLGTPPDGGWPWIAATSMGGFKVEAPLDTLVPGPTTDDVSWILHALLNQGFAVVTTGFEGSGSDTHGVFVAPDDPGGQWSSADPYTFQEKVARWLIQRIVADWSGTYGLNPARGGCIGSSGGGVVWFPVSMGADRASSTGSAQEQASTALLFGVALRTNAWPLAFLSSTTNGAGHYVDATLGFPTPATTLGGANAENIRASSPSFALREPGSIGATTPLFMAYDVAMASLDFSTTPEGFPALVNALDPATDKHAGWSGGMLTTILRQLDAETGTTFHADNSEWWVGNGFESELGAPQSTYVTGTFDGFTLRSTTVRDAIVAFALRHGDLPVPTDGGLELDPETGSIGGTPNALQNLTTHTITATGPSGTASKTVHVQIVSPVQGPTGN